MASIDSVITSTALEAKSILRDELRTERSWRTILDLPESRHVPSSYLRWALLDMLEDGEVQKMSGGKFRLAADEPELV